MSKIDIERVLEIAYSVISSEDEYYDFKREICAEITDIKEGSKITLKDDLGFEGQMDRNKYNRMLVTIDSLYFDDEGKIDTFFIKEDGGRYEWVLDQIYE
jgi:hypothetical protein